MSLDLILDVFQGKRTERGVVSVWKHFPEDDMNPIMLSEKEIAFQEKFQPDLHKFSPCSRYCVIDWGCEARYTGAESGSAVCIKHGVNNSEDWESLEPVDVNDGFYGQTLDALRRTTQKINVPTMMTVFSPVMVADKLAGENFLSTLKEEPAIIIEALKIITDVTKEYAQAAIDNGADGIFFATQHATPSKLNLSQFIEIEQKNDLQIIREIKRKSSFIVMHIHGEDIYFEHIAKNYPIDAINWHDRLVTPSLREAQQIFSGGLIGGVNEWQTLKEGTMEAIQSEVLEAFRQTEGRQLIIGPGCVIPITVRDDHISMVVKTAKNFKIPS